jgi:hypothetical protein
MFLDAVAARNAGWRQLGCDGALPLIDRSCFGAKRAA